MSHQPTPLKEKEQIDAVIENYGRLIALVKEKIKVIHKFDSQYNTNHGIEEIVFEDDSVYVRYDDTCRGCYDSSSFSFPLSYLTVQDDELKDIVIAAKELRIEQEKRAKEERQQKDKEDSEKRDREQYKRLKKKFEL